MYTFGANLYKKAQTAKKKCFHGLCGDGTATITATAGGFSATCEVTVTIAVTEVKLDKSEATLTAKDATLALNVTVLPEYALDKTVTWSTSNAEVATVDENGVVTALANGVVTITATAFDGAKAECVVTVKDIPDGIENVDNDADTVIYDLSGRRVTEMTEGIYIVNGKKVVIKWEHRQAKLDYAEREQLKQS